MSDFSVDVDLAKRLVRTRMSGLFDEESIQAWATAYRDATDRFKGRMHIVLADMRGLKTMRRPVAEALGDAIGYARDRGVVLCAHLSDETVQRLQAKRVARENSTGDDVTVNVASIEEAERACEEALARIDDRHPVASVRQSLVPGGGA